MFELLNIFAICSYAEGVGVSSLFVLAPRDAINYIFLRSLRGSGHDLIDPGRTSL